MPVGRKSTERTKKNQSTKTNKLITLNNTKIWFEDNILKWGTVRQKFLLNKRFVRNNDAPKPAIFAIMHI